MEALGIFKFRRNAAAGAEVVSSDGGDLRNAADDDGDTESEDSFFDLVIKSPDRVAVGGEKGVKKDFRFIESPRDVFPRRSDCSISNSKTLSPVTILRSTPKFKVFMLGLRKSSKCEKTESDGDLKCSTPLNLFSKSSKIDQSNGSSAERRVEKMAVASLLARDNSLRSHLLKETSDYEASFEKSSRDDAVPKYLKLIRPLYLKVSKKQNEKAKFADLLTPLSSPVVEPVNMSPRKLSDGSKVGSFKIMVKHLGKSRSASLAVGIAPPPVRRRDDSLLEQHDGIQGAILYCKKSYNSSSKEFSQLFQSSSDPSHEKLGHLGRNSCEEQKRYSI
ncbi:hypothetical protein CDL12_07224 [Handroanthus impetiginosus]|uniref:Membrane-associated kinase regulator 2 n=1 Tax=Handroanthus impetiginosus TaxID=429701 RepID=A0A2G9HRE3_9LAMI|nr:hypothetical protein CDL12_07224 [Handroanthus impetiginosus]